MLLGASLCSGNGPSPFAQPAGSLFFWTSKPHSSRTERVSVTIPTLFLLFFSGDPEWDLAEQHVVEAALVGVDSVNAAGGLLPNQWGGPYLLELVVRTARVNDDPALMEEAGESSF